MELDSISEGLLSTYCLNPSGPEKQRALRLLSRRISQPEPVIQQLCAARGYTLNRTRTSNSRNRNLNRVRQMARQQAQRQQAQRQRQNRRQHAQNARTNTPRNPLTGRNPRDFTSTQNARTQKTNRNAQPSRNNNSESNNNIDPITQEPLRESRQVINIPAVNRNGRLTGHTGKFNVNALNRWIRSSVATKRRTRGLNGRVSNNNIRRQYGNPVNPRTGVPLRNENINRVRQN